MRNTFHTPCRLSRFFKHTITSHKKTIMTKKTLLSALLSMTLLSAMAQDITLPSPNKSRGVDIMQALSDRQSIRECADKPLSTTDLADLLWAANGVNRPDGKRTAPSAMNCQDIDIYAVTADGAYRYDAEANKLTLVTAGDHRAAVAGRQTGVASFPVMLVLVSDLSKFKHKDDRTQLIAAMDAGYVSQNICLFCAAAGLATVPRASMDEAELRKVLQLTEAQIPLLNNPVGYKK